MLRIGYDAASVPEGGSLVVSSVATFTKTVDKEPAGSIFHTFALRQAGVFGARIAAGSGPRLKDWVSCSHMHCNATVRRDAVAAPHLDGLTFTCHRFRDMQMTARTTAPRACQTQNRARPPDPRWTSPCQKGEHGCQTALAACPASALLRG